MLGVKGVGELGWNRLGYAISMRSEKFQIILKIETSNVGIQHNLSPSLMY